MKPILSTPENTVVSTYESDKTRKKSYQSEQQLENEFISQLQAQGYDYSNITNLKQMTDNLRKELEKLNKITFSNKEWKTFLTDYVLNKRSNKKDKTRIIQIDHRINFQRDDGTTKNIILIDKENIHNNSLQVINQYENKSGNRLNRYDVTILVNGLPLIHIELKRRGVQLSKAFNQITRYQNDSFWADSGMFGYVQLFVISNGTHTKYYSNSVRELQVESKNRKNVSVRSSDSFEFTNWWTDQNNLNIPDLIDFTKTFFAKHSILNILTKYCVLKQNDNSLLVMRPYQIVATEKIIRTINVSNENKRYGSIKAGGFIWHTTGSGKTLTSFKTAKLATKLSHIKKVLFVVDRRDIDSQTRSEYNKFEKGSANAIDNSAQLKSKLLDNSSGIIVTTIQKLHKVLRRNSKLNIYNEQVIFIFDECHRSQFGEMHTQIIKKFKKYYLFGFTGTPIFEENSLDSNLPIRKTTEQTFGSKLHTYTIVNAINDKTVLRFKFDVVHPTIGHKATKKEIRSYYKSPNRILAIVSYILKNFNKKTLRSKTFTYQEKRQKGFNSLFATSSISDAKAYYSQFKKQQENLKEDEKLKIAIIYSYGQNDNDGDGVIDECLENTDHLEKTDRNFLEEAIKDYNKTFNTAYDTGSGFKGYYNDLSNKVKQNKVDILIVVNMFLTGFDAPTLNTLWVDKNLKLHGLLQAFSRPNRILNSVKRFGNIVSFRDIQKEVDESVTLFGDKDAIGIAMIKSFEEYYNGYHKDGEKQIGYKEVVEVLETKYPLEEISAGIPSETIQKEFITTYNKFIKLKKLMETFDQYEGKEIINERDIQDYQGIYLDLKEEIEKKERSDGYDGRFEGVVFELEIIKQLEVNFDYIMNLISEKYNGLSSKQKLIIQVAKIIGSTVELRDKRILVEDFIDSLQEDSNVLAEKEIFFEKKKKEAFDKLIKEESLDETEARNYMSDSFRKGELTFSGVRLDKVIKQKHSIFDNDGLRWKRIKRVEEKFEKFFHMFMSISSDEF